MEKKSIEGLKNIVTYTKDRMRTIRIAKLVLNAINMPSKKVQENYNQGHA